MKFQSVIVAATVFLAGTVQASVALSTPLGDIPEGNLASYAYDVSADGSIVSGTSYTENGSEGFRWTREEGMVGLRDIQEGAINSQA